MCCLMNTSPSQIFQKMLLLGKYYQNCKACFGRCECEWVKDKSVWKGDMNIICKWEVKSERSF